LPGWVAQFEHVAAGVEEVQLSPGKEALPAIDNGLGNTDASLVEELTCLVEHLGADLERMMEAVILFGCSHERIFALAKQDGMSCNSKAGHLRVAKTTLIFESKDVLIELLRFFEIIHRD
jgi:hypothetical protein